ncbi:MAG: DUF72 domain-containing protein [Anaerolineaceae bacterium]|nr:DUF72 domain-containing protein [Anaerolineaceae bacterium]
MKFYIGCPIWANKSWVNSLYPKGTKASDYLRVYAQQLTTVEGNTTFYAVPAQATVQHWAEETPETFRFCPKLPRTISHAGRLMEHQESALQFIDVMRQLGSRLGPIFLQLPPSYSPAMSDDLGEFLEEWPSEVQLAVEVRHLGWFDAPQHQALQSMLSNHHMARVIIDTRPIRSLGGEQILQDSVYERMLQARERKPNLPIVPESTGPFTFLRYIGHPDIAQNAPFLEEWADHLAEWLRNGLDSYVFCHCPDERIDPQLCRDLHRRVSEKAPIDPLPRIKIDTTPGQARLF